MSALIHLNSKVNTTHIIYIKKLKLVFQKTDIGVQKIDGITLKTFRIVIVAFLVNNRVKKICFFEEIFLLANINIDVILRVFF